MLAAVGIHSAQQRHQTSERGSARRTSPYADGGATPPSDAPHRPGSGIRPGDRAVRARAAALRSVSAVGVSLSRSSFIILEINRLQARFFTGLRFYARARF